MVESQDRRQRSEAARRQLELNARYKELFAEVSSIKSAAADGTGRPLSTHYTFAQISRQLEAVTLKLRQGIQ